MSLSSREQIARARLYVSEAIDILESIRAEEEKALEELSESEHEGELKCRMESVCCDLENAIADLVNIEDWLESAKA